MRVITSETECVHHEEEIVGWFVVRIAGRVRVGCAAHLRTGRRPRDGSSGVGIRDDGLAIYLRDHVPRLTAAGDLARPGRERRRSPWVPSWAAMAGLSATKLIPRNGCMACPIAATTGGVAVCWTPPSAA